VRVRDAMDMKWKAVTELIDEVHDGDPLGTASHWTIGAKESFEAGRRDAMICCASVRQTI
jgi:hypothetical protein